MRAGAGYGDRAERVTVLISFRSSTSSIVGARRARNSPRSSHTAADFSTRLLRQCSKAGDLVFHKILARASHQTRASESVKIYTHHRNPQNINALMAG